MDYSFPGSQEPSSFQPSDAHSAPLKSLHTITHQLGKQVVFTPRKGAFKGYSVWVHNGTTSQEVSNEELLTEDTRRIPQKTLAARRAIAVQCDDKSWYTRYFFGAWLSWLFEPKEYQAYLSQVDDYRLACRKDSISIEEKLGMLSALSRHCHSVVSQLEGRQRTRVFFSQRDRVRLNTFREEAHKLKQEIWYIMGLQVPETGEIYLSDQEVSAKENFARGQSATIARVAYKNGFEAVFKPTTHDTEVTSAAADRYGISESKTPIRSMVTKENTGFNEPFQEADEEQIRHVMMFHEVDRLLATDVTPRTRVHEAEGKKGFCETMARTSYTMFSRDDVPLSNDDQARLRPRLLQIYNGEVPHHQVHVHFEYEFPLGHEITEEERARLRLEDDIMVQQKSDGTRVRTAYSFQFPTDFTPSQKNLEKLHLHGVLNITKNRVASMVPLDPCAASMQKYMTQLQLMDYLMGRSHLKPRSFTFYREPNTPQAMEWKAQSSNHGQKFFSRGLTVTIPKQLDLKTALHLLDLSVEQIQEIAARYHLTQAQTEAVKERFRHLQIIIQATIDHQPIPKESQKYINGKLYLIDDQWNQETLNATRLTRGHYIQDVIVKPREEVQPYEPMTAQQAKLANRAVLFCELDSLLGINQTPPTFYSEHNGQSGYCQEFVKDTRELVSEKFVPLPDGLAQDPGALLGETFDLLPVDQQVHYRSMVPAIVKGERPLNGYIIDPEHEPEDIQTLSDQDLVQLHIDGHLKVTQLRTQAYYRLMVPDIVRGRMSTNSYVIDPEHEPKNIQSLSDQELIQLHIDGYLKVTRLRTVDVLPLESSSAELQRHMANAQLLDFITGSVDRNPGNFLYVKHINGDGHACWVPKMIDNDLSFFSRLVVATPSTEMSIRDPNSQHASIGFPSQVDKATAQHICTIDPREIILLAQVHQLPLTDTASLLERFRALQATLKALLQNRPIPYEYKGYIKEGITIVEHWDLRTYRQAANDANSYTCRHIIDRRLDELPNLKDTNPALLVKTLHELLPTLGPKSLARALVRYRPEEILAMMNLYSQHHHARHLAEARQVIIFVNEYFRERTQLEQHQYETERAEYQERQDKEPTDDPPPVPPRLLLERGTFKQERRKAELISKMLGKKGSPAAIGQAIYWANQHGMLSHEILNTLMTQYRKKIHRSPPRQQRYLSYAFKQNFPHLLQVSPDRRALLEHCFSSFSDQEGAATLVPALTIWDTLHQDAISALTEKERDLLKSDEYAEAMHNLLTTPDRLATLMERLRKESLENCIAVLRTHLYPQRPDTQAARDPEKVQQTLRLLAQCFKVEMN